MGFYFSQTLYLSKVIIASNKVKTNSDTASKIIRDVFEKIKASSTKNSPENPRKNPSDIDKILNRAFKITKLKDLAPKGFSDLVAKVKAVNC
jgi:hypothetical protein